MRYIVLCLCLVACSPLTKLQKQENKVARKIQKLQEKYPQAWDSVNTVTVEIDTVIKEIRIQGETTYDPEKTREAITDFIDGFLATGLDSLRETVTETEYVDRFIDRFLEVTKDTVEIDSLDVHLWISGSAVSFRLQRDSTWIKKKTEVDQVVIPENIVVNRKHFYEDWKFWVLLILTLCIIVLNKTGRININLPKL